MGAEGRKLQVPIAATPSPGVGPGDGEEHPNVPLENEIFFL